jgi:hypothetical protein
MGLWVQQIHHPLEPVGWLVSAHHAQHVPDIVLLCMCYSLLFLRKDLPQVDEKQLSAQHVRLTEAKKDDGGQGRANPRSRRCGGRIGK